MKHLPLSLWTALMLPACDAALVASAQQDPVAADAVLAGSVENSEQSEQAALAAKTEAAAETKDYPKVEASIKPEALDLESINFLVKKGKVKNAADLEKKINNPKEKLNNVDVDGDGKLDKIQVVEVQKPGDVKVFELHVIPSKTKKKEDEVIIAYIYFEPDVGTKKLVIKAVYAPIVIGYDTIVYQYHVPIEVKGEKIVVVDSSPFYGWLFLPARPVFVGVYIYSAPPPPVIIIEHGHHWHGHKHKHKGKWKGKGHGWH